MDTFMAETTISVVVAVASVILIAVAYALDVVWYSLPLIQISERSFGESSRRHIRDMFVVAFVVAILAFCFALLPVWFGARNGFVYLVFNLAALVFVVIFYVAVIVPGEHEKKMAPKRIQADRPYTGPIRVSSQEWSPKHPRTPMDD